MIETLFPNGITSYALGGLMVGIGVLFIYVLTAKIPGASTFLESTLSYVSGKKRFQKYASSREWRITFTTGIILGAFIHTIIFREGGFWTTEVSTLRLFLGGILVGVGTRIGKGCTSGHGVNGIGSLSKASFAGVIAFLVAAIVTAQIVTGIGVTP
jgi:uncharacterized membrane protein YedE/YeeE